ncbi:MAG: ABC transporter permease [Parvibaculaceae bacterium]
MTAGRYLPALTALLLALGIWWAAAMLVAVPILVPTPLQVFRGAIDLLASGELVQHLLASLSRLTVGLLIGGPLGAMLGCAMGRFEVVDAIFNPFVRMFNAIPALALVPFSLLWFGATEISRYAILAYTITLTVLLSARVGASAVPAMRERAGQTLGLSKSQVFLKIILPSCFPSILAGTRTALGLGVMVIVAAEMLGAESGFGYLIMQARSHLNMVNMLVGVLGLGLLSLVLDRLFAAFVENFLPRWSVRRRT